MQVQFGRLLIDWSLLFLARRSALLVRNTTANATRAAAVARPTVPAQSVSFHDLFVISTAIHRAIVHRRRSSGQWAVELTVAARRGFGEAYAVGH